jgi:orotidine-5'-phosphate decarboxylase
MTPALHPDSKRGAAAHKLIVALDLPTAQKARGLVSVLHGEVGIFKLGLELIYADGLPFARTLVESGFQLFLDAKLLDIPNTVERATANAAGLGAAFLTVHGTDRKTLDAAMRGRGGSATKLLAVTVLTSLDPADLAEQGVSAAPAELVLRRALLAKDAGFDGVIASPLDAKAIRAELGDDFLIVTPGIRPAGAASADQQRIATPAIAIAAGADYLVVGRPITEAADPAQAADAIISEIEAALPGSFASSPPA